MNMITNNENERTKLDNPELAAQYAKASIDFLVADSEDQFPVISQVLVKSGMFTRAQLDILEEQGHIKSITIEVPSILVPTKTVPEKAYYTENRVPELVKASIEPTDKAKLELL